MNEKAKLIANVIELRRGLDCRGDKQPVDSSVMDHNIMHLIVISARLEGQREVGRGSRSEAKSSRQFDGCWIRYRKDLHLRRVGAD